MPFLPQQYNLNQLLLTHASLATPPPLIKIEDDNEEEQPISRDTARHAAGSTSSQSPHLTHEDHTPRWSVPGHHNSYASTSPAFFAQPLALSGTLSLCSSASMTPRKRPKILDPEYSDKGECDTPLPFPLQALSNS